MNTPALGERLRELRLQKKISMRELARRSEISPSFLCEIEAGRSYPSDSALSRLAEELGVSEARLRKLDMRAYLSELRSLLDGESAWGPVFEELAKMGREGAISPQEVLTKLKSR